MYKIANQLDWADFGMALAQELGKSRNEVLAIDTNSRLINEVKDDVDIAVRVDATNIDALQSQELDNFDYVIVAIGENFEAALLTTVMLKNLGVKNIICRAQTAYHAEIFAQIGAHEIIQPEREAGINLANRLASPHLKDYIPLTDGVSLIEMEAPKVFAGEIAQKFVITTQVRSQSGCIETTCEAYS